MAALIEAAAAADFPAEIVLVISNRADAGGLEKATASGIATRVIESKPFGKDRAAFEALRAQLKKAGCRVTALDEAIAEVENRLGGATEQFVRAFLAGRGSERHGR